MDAAASRDSGPDTSVAAADDTSAPEGKSAAAAINSAGDVAAASPQDAADLAVMAPSLATRLDAGTGVLHSSQVHRQSDRPGVSGRRTA